MITISILLLAISAVIIYNYNRLIGRIQVINNNKHQIDIQLERRYKLLLSLNEILKKYTLDDQTVLTKVMALHHEAHEASILGDQKARITAENQISQIGQHIPAFFEQHPLLNTNQNAIQLKADVLEAENKLNFAKEAYNKNIERYLAEKKSFIPSLIIKFFPCSTDKTFEYWKI